MTHLIYYLGAINKNTREYVHPKIANKKDKYECPGCNKDVFPRQGQILRPHFAHKRSDNLCNYYNHPGETEIHKYGKILMKMLLENNIHISITRTCLCCNKDEVFEIPELGEKSVIQIEYPIEFNGYKVLDVAYIDDGEVICIFEICNTHKTCSENRPEPWFEIDSKTLIELADDNKLTSLKIPCIRDKKCDDCIEKDSIQQRKNQVNQKKNTRYLIRELDRNNFVYLNVDYSKKDFIKNLGGRWNKDHKLWYISHDKYQKHKNELDVFCIYWRCKDCEDIQKVGEENGCYECWKEDVNWIDDY